MSGEQLELVPRPPKLSVCRSCRRSIIWTRTENGKKMPLDADAVADHDTNSLFVLREMENHDGPLAIAAWGMAGLEPHYVSHFATCPNADEHRSRTPMRDARKARQSMLRHRLHVAKLPTSHRTLFCYSHYSDGGHDPCLLVQPLDHGVRLVCEDIFKLKPNVQRSPRTRLDLYLPGAAAQRLGTEILGIVGAGDVGELAGIDPEKFRSGPQVLPVIREARRVQHSLTTATIAGFTVTGSSGPVYIDHEEPNEGHVEMQGPEVHIGIPLHEVSGDLDIDQTMLVQVDPSELRVEGEQNPIRKAYGRIAITLTSDAPAFGATLLHYGGRL